MKNACFNKIAFSDPNARGLLKESSCPFKCKLCVSTRAPNLGEKLVLPSESLKAALQGQPVAQGHLQGLDYPGCSVVGLSSPSGVSGLGRRHLPREGFYLIPEPDTRVLTAVFSVGRKMSLLLNNVFVIVAATLSGFSRMAKSFEMIMLSRFFTGVNAGMAT